MTRNTGEAQEVLKPYFDKLVECIDLGWSDFISECGHIRHKTSPRSRACIVHDNIVHQAKRVFEGDRDILMYDRKGTLTLQIEETFLLRFKKLDEDKLSRGIATQERMDFLEQGELPGIQRGTNIIAGYELNKLQTGIKEISITCPNGNQNSWTLELTRPTAEVIPIHASPAEDDALPLVRIKKTSIAKSKESNGQQN